MSYLHSEGVVHGDLRGVSIVLYVGGFMKDRDLMAYLMQANIFISAHGHAKIADFGLCVYVAGVSRNYFSMRSGNVRWTAPEMIVSDTVADHTAQQEIAALRRDDAGANDGHIITGRPTKETDVYAFACTCVEVCSFISLLTNSDNELRLR